MSKHSIERLALLYSDGSMNILTEREDLARARGQQRSDNRGETRPEHLAKIARVRIEVLELVEQEEMKL